MESLYHEHCACVLLSCSSVTCRWRNPKFQSVCTRNTQRTGECCGSTFQRRHKWNAEESHRRIRSSLILASCSFGCCFQRHIGSRPQKRIATFCYAHSLTSSQSSLNNSLVLIPTLYSQISSQTDRNNCDSFRNLQPVSFDVHLMTMSFAVFGASLLTGSDTERALCTEHFVPHCNMFPSVNTFPLSSNVCLCRNGAKNSRTL